MSSTVGAIDRSQRAVRGDSALGQLSTATSLALFALALALALILIARRLNGALFSPLSGGAILFVALAIESATALYRYMPSCTQCSVLSIQYFPRWAQLLPQRALLSLIIPGVVAFAILASLTIRGTPAWGLTLAWLLFISAESIQWLHHYRPDLVNARWLTALKPVAAPAAEGEPLEVPPGLVQQLTRTLEANQESIHALVRADIAASDRFAAVHLSFCPPLAAQPQLSAHAIDADDAEVRITQAETFGARLEVRLPAANQAPRTVMVEVLGSVTAPRTV